MEVEPPRTGAVTIALPMRRPPCTAVGEKTSAIVRRRVRLRSCGLKPSLSAWKPLRGWCVRHPSLCRSQFLGEMSDVLHSHAPLPLIPPAPFSHKGRRGSLGILMAETGDGTQGLAKKSTPVSPSAGGRRVDPARRACPTSARASARRRRRWNAPEIQSRVQRI